MSQRLQDIKYLNSDTRLYNNTMSTSASIDNQIARYVTHNFNAELEAQYIFKSYGENDILKQLNDMNTIQSSIETGDELVLILPFD